MTWLLGYAWSALVPIIFHWGVGIGIVICAVAVAWFTPFKKTGAAVAICTGAFLVGMTVGTVDERHRWEAKVQAAIEQAEKARADAIKAIPKPGAKRPTKRWFMPAPKADPNNRDR